MGSGFSRIGEIRLKADATYNADRLKADATYNADATYKQRDVDIISWYWRCTAQAQ